MKRLQRLLFTVLVAIPVGYGLLPYWSLYELRSALRTGDEAKLEQAVAFPRVREHLKNDLQTRLSAEVERTTADGEAGGTVTRGLADLFGPVVIDRLLAEWVTPDKLAGLVKQAGFGQDDPDPGPSPGSETGGDTEDENGLSLAWAFFTGPTTFEARFRNGVVLQLERQGWRWPVVGVELPAGKR
ncbi:MAG: DUF2939 domain-containing protein [Opitutales bacterium]